MSSLRISIHWPGLRRSVATALPPLPAWLAAFWGLRPGAPVWRPFPPARSSELTLFETPGGLFAFALVALAILWFLAPVIGPMTTVVTSSSMQAPLAVPTSGQARLGTACCRAFALLGTYVVAAATLVPVG